MTNCPSEHTHFADFTNGFHNSFAALEKDFRGLIAIKMRWATELKGMLDSVAGTLALNAKDGGNKYAQSFGSLTVAKLLDLLKKTFAIYAPKADKTLEEILIMAPRDFKVSFLAALWRELEKVAAAFTPSAPLPESLKAVKSTLADTKTFVKDMFRYFKDV